MADHSAPVPDTAQAVALFASHSIHDRAEGARTLSLHGGPEHLELLVRLAQSDPSPAVRLGTAGAAADILSRHRLPPASERLDRDRRRRLLEMFRGIDPGVNAGLFPLLACIGLTEAFGGIAVGLADPRGGVRVGAAVGLLRLCSSSAAAGDGDLEARVVALFREPRIPPDSKAELARVCAAVGYRTAEPVLHGLHLSRGPGKAVHAAILVLEAGSAPPLGAWISDGRDAGEVSAEPARPPALLVVGPDGSWHEKDGCLVPMQPSAPTRLRRLLVRRVGEAQPRPAVQDARRTWWRAGEAELGDALDRVFAPDAIRWTKSDPDAVHLADALLPHLSDSGTGCLIRGRMLGLAGRTDEAIAALTAATTAKKPSHEAWFWLGEARSASGDDSGARAAWKKFVEKGKKSDPLAVRAAARLEPPKKSEKRAGATGKPKKKK